MPSRKIIRADILGYCMGVRRAVEIAEDALNVSTSGTVFTLGPLIHNKVALDSLSKKGLKVLEQNEIPTRCTQADTVIIRAHGIPPKTRDLLKQTGCKIIDATCPRVLSSQKRAADFATKGYTVILAGDKNHGEVAGISGCAKAAGQECIVIENSDEAKQLENLPQKAVLLSQTTISRKEYDDIATVLKQKITDLQVFNTICPATSERQLALKELCQKVDGVLVIGGKNSANTQRLYAAAEGYCSDKDFRCKKAAFIETPDEVPKDFKNLEIVGLTAGASTPDEIIDAVELIVQTL